MADRNLSDATEARCLDETFANLLALAAAPARLLACGKVRTFRRRRL